MQEESGLFLNLARKLQFTFLKGLITFKPAHRLHYESL